MYRLNLYVKIITDIGKYRKRKEDISGRYVGLGVISKGEEVTELGVGFQTIVQV